MHYLNRARFAPNDGTGAAAVIAGAPAVGTAPAAGAAFTWDPGLEAPVVDLLKAKGMYDDPTKGANMLAKSYFDTNRVLSGNPDVLPVPTDWTKDDASEKFFSKTRGVAKPEEYEVQFGEGVETNPALIEFGRKLAFMWGVPKALVQKGFDEWQKFGQEQGKIWTTNQQKANDDAVTAMKTKHGDAVFAQNVANAQNVFKALAAKSSISKETLTAVEKNIGSAALMELMFAIGGGMKEAPILGGNDGNNAPTDPSQMTPEQAQAEITRLGADNDFQKSYLDAKHPGHATSVERMKNLYAAKVRRPG